MAALAADPRALRVLRHRIRRRRRARAIAHRLSLHDRRRCLHGLRRAPPARGQEPVRHVALRRDGREPGADRAADAPRRRRLLRSPRVPEPVVPHARAVRGARYPVDALPRPRAVRLPLPNLPARAGGASAARARAVLRRHDLPRLLVRRPHRRDVGAPPVPRRRRVEAAAERGAARGPRVQLQAARVAARPVPAGARRQGGDRRPALARGRTLHRGGGHHVRGHPAAVPPVEPARVDDGRAGAARREHGAAGAGAFGLPSARGRRDPEGGLRARVLERVPRAPRRVGELVGGLPARVDRTEPRVHPQLPELHELLGLQRAAPRAGAVPRGVAAHHGSRGHTGSAARSWRSLRAAYWRW